MLMWLLPQWPKKEQMGGGSVHMKKQRLKCEVPGRAEIKRQTEKCEIKGRLFPSSLRRGIPEHIYAVWATQWRRGIGKQDAGVYSPWEWRGFTTQMEKLAFERVSARGKTSRIGRLRITALFLGHHINYFYFKGLITMCACFSLLPDCSMRMWKPRSLFLCWN